MCTAHNEHEYKNNKQFITNQIKDKTIITLGPKGSIYKDVTYPVPKVEIKDVVFEDYENSLITTIYYKDEEIYCDADTTGKSFDSYLDKRENF